jgi:hypothetical protein
VPELSRPNRLVAAALATVWLAAGLAGLGIGMAARRWVLIPVGLGAVWYGLLWVRVVQTGRQLKSLWPWGRA